MAASLKFLLFLVVAVACVLALPAEESERVKKQVYLGSYGYGAYPYASAPAYAAAPVAYSAGYAAAPVAYSAGYSAYPYAGYAGYRSLYY